MRIEVAVWVENEFVDGPEAAVIHDFQVNSLDHIKKLAGVCIQNDLYSVQVFDYSPKLFTINWEKEEPEIGEAYPFRADLVTLNVTKNSFFWKGYLKNSGIAWRTRHLGIADIQDTDWNTVVKELE